MRSTLEPLIDKLFEEDELFMQDFEDDGLSRVLFIRKMGIYVEVSYKLAFNVYHNEKKNLSQHIVDNAQQLADACAYYIPIFFIASPTKYFL